MTNSTMTAVEVEKATKTTPIDEFNKNPVDPAVVDAEQKLNTTAIEEIVAAEESSENATDTDNVSLDEKVAAISQKIADELASREQQGKTAPSVAGSTQEEDENTRIFS